MVFDSSLFYKFSSNETANGIQLELQKGNKTVLNLTNIDVKGNSKERSMT